jgi:alkylhydroperoxidase family enzyme
MALLLNQIEWGEPLLPVNADPALEAEAKKTFGAVPGVLKRVMGSPWIARFYIDLFCTRFVAADEGLLDLAGFVTAQENSCRYCYGATRAALKILGYSEARVNRIERLAEMAELDEKERAVIQFCRQLARSNPRPGEAEQAALAQLGYGGDVMKELCFYVATQCFSNRVATMLAVPPEARLEQLSGSFFGRVLRPVISRLLRKKPPSRLAARAVDEGPFGAVAGVFAGLPCAAPLREVLDAAFASTVLGRRAKTLMFAVVGHSLGCTTSCGEARRLLVADGLTGAEVDQILANLGGPGLDPTEAALVPFARDTVRYQTGPIQKRVRELKDQLGDDIVLEAIGIAALANAVVRLGMLSKSRG